MATPMEILTLAAANADYMHLAICPVCHSCMEIVFSGSSGHECWCPTKGCNVGFAYGVNAEFKNIVLCPADWVGEDA